VGADVVTAVLDAHDGMQGATSAASTVLVS